MFTFPVFVQHIIHFWSDLRAFTSADTHVSSCHTAKQARHRQAEMWSPLITRNSKQMFYHQHSFWVTRLRLTTQGHRPEQVKSDVQRKKWTFQGFCFFFFGWLGFFLVCACVLIILFTRGSHSLHLQTRSTLAFLLILLYQACLSTVFADPPCETAINNLDRQV